MNANLRAFSFTQGNHERYCGQKYDEIEWRDVFFGGTFSAFSQGGSFFWTNPLTRKLNFVFLCH
jgi:hypothetical protein